MKKLIIILIILFSLKGFSQNPVLNFPYLGNPTTNSYIRGWFSVDSGLAYKNIFRDTLINPFAVGEFRIRNQDTSLYVSVSTTASLKWVRISGGGGGSGTGSVTSVSSLSPLFITSNPTTTPTFALSNTTQYTVFGRSSSGSGVPSYVGIDTTWISNFSTKVRSLFSVNHALTYSNGIIALNKTFQTLTDGTTVTWNTDNGYNAQLTIGGNRTLNITNTQNGDYGTLKVTQNGTGGWTLALPNGTVALNPSPGAITILGWAYDGTNYNWSGGYYPRVDTIYREPGKDSTIFTIDGRRHAVKDSVGSGGSGTPGGSTTQMQYNLSGAFAGASNVIYNASGELIAGGTTDNGSYSLQNNGNFYNSGNLDLVGTTHIFNALTVTKSSGDMITTFENTTTGGASQVLVKNGNGTSAVKFSYIRFQNNYSSVHNMDFGFYGNDNLTLRDVTGSITPLTIASATGRMGIMNTSPATLLHLGTAGTTAGNISLDGSSSGTISLLTQAAAGTYNWNWPTTAGTSGYLLTSGGGSSTAMTWTDPATFQTVANLSTNTSLGSSNTLYPSQLAVKTYVDNIGSNQIPKAPVDYATAASLAANTYANGASGVGATITMNATGTVTIDGHVTALNENILIKDESTQSHNGIYTVTTAGAVGVAGVFTRRTDFDQASEIVVGAEAFVINGSANAGKKFTQNATVATVGTDAIVFVQTGGASGVSWGSITGTLSAQTDLQTALDAKASTALSNLASVAINTSLLPATDNSIDLGSASKQWKDLYMTGASIYMAGVKTLSTAGLDLPSGGGIRTRTSAGNTVLLQAYDVDGAAYTTFGTLTANNTPTLDFSSAVTFNGSTLGTNAFTSTTYAPLNSPTFTGTVALGSSPTMTTPIISGLATGSGVASAATASTLAARDANGNLTTNNYIPSYTSTATAGTTTTLTVSSPKLQYFTGSTTQTVTMPVAGTLVTGQSWIIVNSSTGDVTVQSSGGNSIQVMIAGSYLEITCISTAGTGTSSWNAEYVPPQFSSNISNSIVLRDASGNFSAGTITATLTGSATSASTLQTARNIGGVSFNGSADIVPQTIESANEATDATSFPLFVTASGTQQLQPKNNTSLTFDASAAKLGSTIFNAGTGFRIGDAAASGKILIGNGTNYVASTPTYPNSATSGNFLVGDGTNIGLVNTRENWTSFAVSGIDATTTGQTLVDVTGLTSGTLTNSTKYEVEAWLDVGTSNVTTGTQYGIGAGGTGGAAVVEALVIGTTTTNAVTSVTENAASTAQGTFLTTSSSSGVVHIHGFVTTRGSGTATISIQHLKVTSGTSTVRVGSKMLIRLAN